MVRALVTAYGRSADEVAVPSQMRFGICGVTGGRDRPS
jgi:hypothetical protein